MAEKHKCSCHAFTIREYANKMRSKKWEDDTSSNSSRRRVAGRLKVVPKYRWWRCKECGLEPRPGGQEERTGEPTLLTQHQNHETTPNFNMPRRRRRLVRLRLSLSPHNYNTAGPGNPNETMKLRNGKTIERGSSSSRIPSERENNTIISSFRMAPNPNPNPTTLPLLSHCGTAAQNVGSGVDKCNATDNAPLPPPPPPPRNKGILIREAAPNANAAHQSLRIRSSHSSTPIIRLGKAPTLHNNPSPTPIIRPKAPTLHNNPSATSIITLGKAPILHKNAVFSDEDDDDNHDDDTESDEDIKMLRLELMAGTRKPDIQTRIDDTLKGGAYGSYGNQSSAQRLSPGTNFQPNQPRRNIATGFPIHTGSSSHINTPTGLPGSPSPSINNRDPRLILPRPKIFNFPLPSNPNSSNNLTFHPQLSNLGEASTLQPAVTPLYGGPMSLNPQQQSPRLMLQLSQLGTTRPPPMTTDANNTTSGGVLHKNQGSSQGNKKDSQ